MEIAKLANQEIDILKEWSHLRSCGHSIDSAVDTLEHNYRIHSQKHGFRCKCCDQEVTMVLRKGSPHFRHQGERCPSADNYKSYINRVNNYETKEIHSIGRIILRVYLEGQLKIKGVTVEDGYMYRTLLKIVPDFILTFPDGRQWAIDYVTGKKQDDTYRNYINKRTNTYKEFGFKPVYFIDSSWIAEHPDHSMITLYLAENQMRVTSSKDRMWTNFIQEYYDTFGEEFVHRELFKTSSIKKLDPVLNIYSLAYVNPNEGLAWIQRLIPYSKKFGYHVYRSTLSLDQVTTLSADMEEFQWWDENEDQVMIDTLNQLSAAFENEYEIPQNEPEAPISLGDNFQATAIDSVNGFYLKGQANTPSSSAQTLVELINESMDVTMAKDLVEIINNLKSQMSREDLVLIRAEARSVMGKLSEHRNLPWDLREVLIEIALIT
ncbi:hypothetical protein OM416_19530 [Paenibacillus sp. LS1]|uniref:hypothetical protein n=1 Tax=Paenibacillus sp. LS1 TaxID=2992120 RepID=UPI00222E5355|nr:hypothetical protein [Paenibacillus sp. LS1]MCW3793788.1 hypothetical protein [Paenibacillus sp. LS1]